ncbi:MAG TPA: hypothetical protein VFP40_09515 [Terriglobales bacterium]|nr:hypothetical protein [Terriglobales bacterium]
MNSDTGASPQFETVEYAPTPGNCVLCNQPIGGTYYRINGQQACPSCAQREQAGQGSSAKYYSRALGFGIGAAIVGLIGYAAFEIITGWIIGYVALGVGWLIGKAMMKGSNGFGGRKYQITAALLTYSAVSLAAIPVMISQISKQKKEPQAQVQVQQPSAPETATPSDPGVSTSDGAATPDANSAQPAPSSDLTFPGDRKPQTAPAPEKPRMGFGKAIGMLTLIGLASPFLELADPFHGIIGLFILFIGIRIAWKMTARPDLVIDGPF